MHDMHSLLYGYVTSVRLQRSKRGHFSLGGDIKGHTGTYYVI